VGRYLYAEFFEFEPTHKIWIATNHKPVIHGTDHAMWRRICLIPFRVTIPEAEQDKAMADKLLAELDGILAWAVQGCLDWQKSGLAAPPEVRLATQRYRKEQDIVGTFLTDCCMVRQGAEAQATDLYRAYSTWCDDNGEQSISGTLFGRQMTERGLAKIKSGCVYYQGIGLLSDQDDRHES
jgi:putative DNA primase/helicase